MKKLEAVFPSRDAAITVRKFRGHALRLASGGQKKTGDAEEDLLNQARAAYRVRLVEQAISALPSLRRAFEEERKREEAARKREEARLERERRREQSKPETLRQRVDRLERENAELRARIDSRPPTAEDELKIRKYYEDNDTRIGGDRDPGPGPGLRD